MKSVGSGAYLTALSVSLLFGNSHVQHHRVISSRRTMTTMSEEKKSTSAQSSVEPSRGRDGQAVDADLEDIHIEDEAGSVAAKALQRGEAVSSDMSNRVLKKLDTYILPFLCVTYGLQLMDKSTLQYSSVYGLIPDNHLIGQDYSWASSIFYFGYLLAE